MFVKRIKLFFLRNSNHFTLFLWSTTFYCQFMKAKSVKWISHFTLFFWHTTFYCCFVKAKSVKWITRSSSSVKTMAFYCISGKKLSNLVDVETRPCVEPRVLASLPLCADAPLVLHAYWTNRCWPSPPCRLQGSGFRQKPWTFTITKPQWLLALCPPYASPLIPILNESEDKQTKKQPNKPINPPTAQESKQTINIHTNRQTQKATNKQQKRKHASKRASE